ncbi:hypothetical protein H9Q69_006766 [Fusarium xylarioides]|uniref:Uncharacterized protein n=1 Tax=Fusarium xylarioides TaxID=221167 RepID=A0A9P7LGX5_9HYPO|nr:hypothetical protein H9Q70_005543 [Fusarium xylarioides]KAG5760527.1 hypothetical protein H9Q72_011365 [Fusarium xylarioides]KAG5767553.1 hypothetical protein H9Q73_014132 [Fusarium xylarioides]KAG5794204.1 hypothetical protein H9Q69_006766 [Fusarium xylarioides]KAG5813290.1 hypothetical protein H9Q71_003838 [Fusarium xylarioides]
MGAILEDSLDGLLAGDLSDFREKRAAILEPAYESYLISTDFRKDSPRPSSTYLLPSSEVVVLISRCPETEAAIDLHIIKLSDTFAENFIGYCSAEKCIVFKGERGLIEDFIDSIESAAGGKEVTVVLKASEQIRIPLGGLEHGLKYEEFAARVEILECALWIGNSPTEQEEGGIRFKKLAADPKLPEPITSNRMPTPDSVNITNGNSLSNEEPPNISSTNIRSSATDASSPLSEPPSSPSIHTPSSPLSDPPSDIDEISLHNWDDTDESSSSPSSSSSSSEGAQTPPSLREWE